MPSAAPRGDSPDLGAPPTSSFGHELKSFSDEWLRLNWPNLIAMLVVSGLSLGIYYAPTKVVRTFPITFNRSGDIIYPEWAYPYRGWILPSWLSGLLSIGVPMLVYFLAQIGIRSAWDASNAIMGTAWALLMGSLFQVTVKQLIGGFRPYFLDVCMPDISLAETRNRTGLNGVGFMKVMYTTEICTQPDRRMLQNAVTSFPSGHSTAAFAGFIFLLLWLNAKLKVWADHRPSFWKLSLTLTPLLAAVMIACSLTIDAAHNWYDILGGSVIGTIMAFAAYRSSYAAVLDWRFNHVPLQERESFAYDGDEVYETAGQTMSRRARWGEYRRGPGRQNAGAGPRAFFAHQPGKSPREDAGQTAAEDGRGKQPCVVGEEAV